MTIIKRAFQCATLFCASAFFHTGLTATTVQAAEGGGSIVPFGVLEFGSGMLPPAASDGTVGTRVSYYYADKQKDGHGNTVNNFRLNVETLGFTYIKMTDLKFLGANVGFSGVLPFMSINGNLNIATPVGPLRFANSDLNLGDIEVVPVLLGWQAPPNLFVNAGVQIQAPTGAYSRNKTFNAGVNHWTFSPFVGATYITDSGFEVSSQFMVSFNTENPDTNYTSGDEFKQEFGIGQHLGAWTVGAGGYYYQQFTDDHGAGATSGNRGRVLALGPSISYFSPGKPLVALHAYKEFAVENRAEGYTVAVRAAINF
jgi:hypothetical protein